MNTSGDFSIVLCSCLGPELGVLECRCQRLHFPMPSLFGFYNLLSRQTSGILGERTRETALAISTPPGGHLAVGSHSVPVREGEEGTVSWVLSLGHPRRRWILLFAENELGGPEAVQSAPGPKGERGGEERGAKWFLRGRESFVWSHVWKCGKPFLREIRLCSLQEGLIHWSSTESLDR